MCSSDPENVATGRNSPGAGRETKRDGVRRSLGRDDAAANAVAPDPGMIGGMFARGMRDAARRAVPGTPDFPAVYARASGRRESPVRSARKAAPYVAAACLALLVGFSFGRGMAGRNVTTEAPVPESGFVEAGGSVIDRDVRHYLADLWQVTARFTVFEP